MLSDDGPRLRVILNTARPASARRSSRMRSLRNRLLSLQPRMSGQDVGQIPMRSGQPHYQASAQLENLGRKVDEVAAKALPLPTHYLRGQDQLGDPLAQIPRQPSYFQPRRVAHELRHRHAPAGNPVTELLDDVFLVAALIGQIDDPLGRVRTRQIAQHQAVAEMPKQRPLTISLFNQNPPHDHPTRKGHPRGLVVDLADPLPRGVQRAVPSLLGFALTVVGSAPLTSRLAWLVAL